MSSPLRIVVDTCVWVNNYCPDHAQSQEARRFLQLALKHDAQLLYAVHLVNDVLYIVDHELRRVVKAEEGTVSDVAAQAAHATALACARNMRELATAVGADESDLWLADKYLKIHNDFEDNLVLAACRRANVDFLVSCDEKLLRHADVAAKTPAEMSALLEL